LILFAAVEIDVLDVEGVDVTRDVTEDCETNIDKKVAAAAGDHENTNWREKDGDEDNDEGGRYVRHCALVVESCWTRRDWAEYEEQSIVELASFSNKTS
jgi:hypothetical protein